MSKVYGVNNNKDSNICTIQHVGGTAEWASEHLDYYLTDDTYHPDEYRLHSGCHRSMKDYLRFQLPCPKCTASGHMLVPIGGPLNSKDLTLYECPACKKENERRRRY